MIIKSFNVKNLNTDKNNLFLLYGNNKGSIKDTIKHITKGKKDILSYDEKQILENQQNFLEDILNKSLFDEKKIIIIKRASDKIKNTLEIINTKKIEDIIIIVSDNLEKKSKLRNFFEKDRNLICIPFYPDNEQTLSKLALEFLKEKKISMARADLNIIIRKSVGDRENLFNELNKIENYSKNGKKISGQIILKLINQSETQNISELIDNCLAKNQSKTVNILNENNFINEDCILIIRTFLNKAKKLHTLTTEYQKNKNIDLTINNSKPPIFWKDKEIVKKQIYKWDPNKIKNLIFQLNELELIVKKNVNISMNLTTNFVLEQIS